MGKKFTVTVSILKDLPYELLLGTNLLVKMGISINLAHQILQFMDGTTIPLDIFRKLSVFSIVFHATQDYLINDRVLKPILVQADQVSVKGDYMVESVCVGSENANLVAHLLHRLEVGKSRFPVLIDNLPQDKIHIYVGQIVGTLSPAFVIF